MSSRHCCRCGESCGAGSRRVFLRVGLSSYAARGFERSADLTGEWCERCAWMLLDFALAFMPSTARVANDAPTALLPTPEREFNMSHVAACDTSPAPANDNKPRRRRSASAGASVAALSDTTDAEGTRPNAANANGGGSSRPPLCSELPSGTHERPEPPAGLVRVECPVCGKPHQVGPLCRELACSCGNVAQARALLSPPATGHRLSAARVVSGAASAPLPEPPLRGGVRQSRRGGVQT